VEFLQTDQMVFLTPAHSVKALEAYINVIINSHKQEQFLPEKSVHRPFQATSQGSMSIHISC